MLLVVDCPICNKHYETNSDEIVVLGMVPIIGVDSDFYDNIKGVYGTDCGFALKCDCGYQTGDYVEELHAPEYRKKLNSIDYKTTNITAKMIKEFRELTGQGIMDIKKVLIICEGNFRKAYDLLMEANCFGKYVDIG